MSKNKGNLAVVEEPVQEENFNTIETVDELPSFDQVGASPEEQAAAAAQKQLRSGFCYLLHAIHEQLSVAKETKSLMWVLTLAPCVEVAGDLPKPKRPTIKHNIILPFVNVKAPGHEAPDTWDMCAKYLAAEDNSFPAMPTRVEKSKPAKYETRGGSIIDGSEYGKEKLKVIAAVTARLKQRYQAYQQGGSSAFLNGYVYGLVKAQTQTSGKYAGRTNLNIVAFSSKPIMGVTYLTDAKQFGEAVNA